MKYTIKRLRPAGTPYIYLPKVLFDEFISDAEEVEVEITFEKKRIIIEVVNNDKDREA